MLRRKFLYVFLVSVIFLLTILSMMTPWSDRPHVKNELTLSNKIELVKQVLDSLSFELKQDNQTKTIDEVELAKKLKILHRRHVRDDKLPQICKIPVLDPYHPDVKPFIKRWSIPDCKYPELSEVTDDGLLRVSKDNKFIFS